MLFLTYSGPGEEPEQRGEAGSPVKNLTFDDLFLRGLLALLTTRQENILSATASVLPAVPGRIRAIMAGDPIREGDPDNKAAEYLSGAYGVAFLGLFPLSGARKID